MKTKYFEPKRHIFNLIENPHYQNLAKLRNLVETACDEFFQDRGALKADLFLITKAVSSPMGKGSDSSPLPLEFGKNKSFLVDSAQFGMEPLVLGTADVVYCYLPSFRGEDGDQRHLNQFFHCEAELKGDYEKAMGLAEKLIKHLAKEVRNGIKTEKIRSKSINKNLAAIVKGKFPIITFDEAEGILAKNSSSALIKRESYGRVITNKGELEVAEKVGKGKLPVWITKYDRGTVAFYQKPDPDNKNRALNADLVFPPTKGGFGGEIIGLGQRQDNIKELKESMSRQKIANTASYAWYLNLRKHPKYQTTSGFGLGVERFLAWILNLDSIIDASLFPVIKNVKTEY